MSGEIVKAEATHQLAERVRLTEQGLAVELEQRKLLNRFVRTCMVSGTDYGVIPGTDKPTLLKPGAEKLVDLFRCTPEFVIDASVTDFDKGMFYYRFKVRLFSEAANRVLAEGVGSANSREGRYRWRNANRLCPACGKEAIIQGKEEYGGGWVCFKKKGGCGAKYKAGDKAIEGQMAGRVENEDIADLDNTILKMAKKRALVDGAIALARCSDLFTQDVEDFAEYRPDGPAPSKPQEERGAYGPPSGPDADRDAVNAQFAAASMQVTGEAPKPAEQTHAQFGPYKGQPIAHMSDDAVAESIAVGTEMLADPKNAKAKWRARASTNLAALQAEVELRKAPPEPGSAG